MRGDDDINPHQRKLIPISLEGQWGMESMEINYDGNIYATWGEPFSVN